ncbi:hypothetical protein NQ318_012078 [Aromia moschata]|uniref:Uncharacterized protein n=1 Tax=Aromia moschata TaxID=1265417 RepID=A0AAV8X3T7_9CUCU|nr:hypothetical protein NQ318_012078 [Aromia moschata]
MSLSDTQRILILLGCGDKTRTQKKVCEIFNTKYPNRHISQSTGKDKRDKSLQALAQHLLDTYVPLKRKWLVLFPEGGFLRKRKAISHQYAAKMNLPGSRTFHCPELGLCRSSWT